MLLGSSWGTVTQPADPSAARTTTVHAQRRITPGPSRGSERLRPGKVKSRIGVGPPIALTLWCASHSARDGAGGQNRTREQPTIAAQVIALNAPPTRGRRGGSRAGPRARTLPIGLDRQPRS